MWQTGGRQVKLGSIHSKEGKSVMKNQLPPEVECVFRAPFPIQSGYGHYIDVLPLASGKRYLLDNENSSSLAIIGRVLRDGQPDKTFNGGQVGYALEMGPADPAGLLPRNEDGVIAALSNATQLGLICLKADGQLDPSFGNEGAIVHSYPDATLSRPTQASGTSDICRTAGGSGILSGGLGGHIAPAEGGKLFGLLGARFYGPAALMRCLPNGQLDPTFANSGIVSVSHPDSYSIPAPVTCISMSDGGVVIAGTITSLAEGMRGFFCRYDDHGDLDKTFGQNGFALFDSTSADVPPVRLGQMELNHITRLANGGLAASGYVYTKDPVVNFGLVICINEFGQPIGSFNGGKPLLFRLPDPDIAYFVHGGIVEQTDGKLVVGGVASQGSGSAYRGDMLAVRFNQDGGKDMSFGGQGWVRVRPENNLASVVTDVVLDENGGILIAGAGGPDTDISRQIDYVVQFK
jgi:uncharacterized delta-60 repeat protein